jgi:biotin carboxylase
MIDVDAGRPSRPLVLFSPGAVLLRDLIAGLAGCDDILFVCDSPARDSGVLPLLAEIGQVHLHDDAGATAERVAAFAPDGVVTFVEHLLPLAATLAARFGLRFHSPHVARVLRDKAVQRRVLAQAGVDDVRFRTVHDADQCRTALGELGVPAVLKPAHGAGSSDTFLVTASDQVEEIFAGLTARAGTAFQLEEYLPGRTGTPYADYVSVESIAQGGRIHHLGITGKLPLLPPFRETGQFHPCGLDADEQHTILQLATDAMTALGMTDGQAHTEIKLTPSGPRIIEVNGRLGGYINELYSRVLGTDAIELCVRMACGARHEMPTDARPGVHFQYYHQPPPGADRLLGVTGHRDAARSHGVVRYDRLVAPGAPMPVDCGSFDLDLVSGSVETHDELLARLGEVQSRLAFTFEHRGEQVVCSGTDLARGMVL